MVRGWMLLNSEYSQAKLVGNTRKNHRGKDSEKILHFVVVLFLFLVF